MASIEQHRPGHWRIVYRHQDASKKLYLGKCSQKSAQAFLQHFEALLTNAKLNVSLPAATTLWLDALPAETRQRLAEKGLAPPASLRHTLGELTTGFINSARIKTSTLTFYSHTVRNLLEYFGAQCPLADINGKMAEDFRCWLTDHEKLSRATTNRRITAARTIFAKAVAWNMIDRNPFLHVKGGLQTNPDRQRYISEEEIYRVINACSNPNWKAIFALARFAGLRMPSEVHQLKWTDIQFDAVKDSAPCIRIRSPKTEHHLNRDHRIIPLFAELRPILMDLRAATPADSEYILPREILQSNNLRTQARRIIRRAGIEPWPKTFHNLRASRESDLMKKLDIATAAKWMGNTPEVAARHYAVATNYAQDFFNATEAPQWGGFESCIAQ